MKLRAPLRVVATLAALAGLARAEPSKPVETLFRDANALYARGDYQRAADTFRSIVDAGQVSAPLLYDLGNAEAMAGRTGQAVLSYERALVLAPRDADVTANLRQTRTAANLPAPPRDRWRRIAALLSVDEWATVAAAALWLACLLAAAHAIRRTPNARRSRRLLATAGALLLVAALAVSLAATRMGELDRGVVLGEAPVLQVAPFPAATASVELAPGQLVDLEREHDGFVLVRTDEGQAGWIRRDHVERIVPR